MIQVTPHLNFRGNARSVLEFYQSVFGGDISIYTFKDAHNMRSEGGVATSEEAEQIMWGQVLSDEGFRIMAYDVPSAMTYDPGEKPMYISLATGPISRTEPASCTTWDRLPGAPPYM